jgi:predicted Holliday junction resolvase-like endonuclease
MEALLFIAVVAIIVLTILYFNARMQSERSAREQYERWRKQETDRIVQEQRVLARKEAQVDLARWQDAHEAEFRQDAVARSRAVIVGNVTQHLTPWVGDFPYNPKDARFIGSPIDMIIFDGADENEIRRVVFLEIKTNASALSGRQRQIRDAIRAGKVEWRELRIVPAEAR